MTIIRSFILLITLAPIQLFAQNLEFGVFAGGTYYYGDVSTEFHYQNVRVFDAGYIRKRLDSRRSLRLNVAFARIAGLDSANTSYFETSRNLNFYTDIYEGSVQYEYNLVDEIAGKKAVANKFVPYIFGGVGLIYFVPKTVYAGVKYQLAPLKTSGITYSQLAVVFPLGMGVKYNLSPRFYIGLEGTIRITSTSDLDDIRGNSVYPDANTLPSETSKLLYDRSKQVGYGKAGKIRGHVDYITDCYFLYGITIGLKVGKVSNSRAKGKSFGGHMKCPRFY